MSPETDPIPCLFASDLHGDRGRYWRLLEELELAPPALLFLGGDLLPPGYPPEDGFLRPFLMKELSRLKGFLGSAYPRICLIPGNDDPRRFEPVLLEGEKTGLWTCLQQRRLPFSGYSLVGYPFVPPTPFLLKDWERYDVSRFVDPGCVPPTEGYRSIPIDPSETESATILEDLWRLAGDGDQSRTILLSHAPPYGTDLDRADLETVKIDHAPADLHIGSVAVARFIADRQPLLSLHGHAHQSFRLTGRWRQRIGSTLSINAAGEGPELVLVGFDLQEPESAQRRLLDPV